jgi:hypothetical protein
VARRERHILERAVHAVTEHATKPDGLVDEPLAASFDESHAVTIQAKMLLELLQAKGDLERELGKPVLNCSALRLDV